MTSPLSFLSTCSGCFASFSSLFTTFSYSSAMFLFSLHESTFSKTPKGTTALRGVSIQSGRVLLDLTMFVLLAPNVLGRASGSTRDSGRVQAVNFVGGGSSTFRPVIEVRMESKRPLFFLSIFPPEPPPDTSSTWMLPFAGVHLMTLPRKRPRDSNSSSSKQVAKSTFRFLARTEMWARTSGASRVMMPLTPAGGSSSPLMEFASRIVSSSYV
mmetsp:Transcript_455/g.1024  ORF Transcript_455/g.1024 Transcript_455/m.1024 type:complete len:213 (-) Transcript_455:1445-2083(-)